LSVILCHYGAKYKGNVLTDIKTCSLLPRLLKKLLTAYVL